MQVETFKVEGQKGLFNQIDLDLHRTKRVYKVLGQLSDKAMNSLKLGDLKEFSSASDRMRPMLSYIADNQITLSKHFEDQKDYQEENELLSLSRELKTNLNTVEAARKSLSQVDFNPAFFLSEELTNAYLDYQLPMAWEFEHDLIVIKELNDLKLLETIISRGQKRIFIVGGNLNISDVEIAADDVTIYKTEDYKQLDDLICALPKRPPRRFVLLDVGSKPTEIKKINKIRDSLISGRSRAWLRFNTINRGDAVKILDNLSNILLYRQTSEFHETFKGKPAVIVCPGPSLKKNIKSLKKINGKALIICVLHALKPLKAAGIIPDIVIHTDPQNLKSLHFEKDGELVSQYDHWMNGEDFEGVSYFITSATGSPDNFDIPVKEVLWMSCGIRIGDFLPLDVFDYTRVGGSVSHSAFDLALELGCSKVALVGQDLAFGENGELYSKEARLDMSKQRLDSLGERFKVKGYYGKKVDTNASFSFFASFYEYFAKNLNKNTNISLFNCTEGGIYLDGFKHIPLEEFIDTQLSSYDTNLVEITLGMVQRDPGKYKKNKEKLTRFIKDNINLGKEVDRLSKVAVEIAKKSYHTDEDLRRFDLVQNKTIKKLTKNFFYTLGLQKEIYILQAGVAADSSIEGQLGFHLDFLKAARNFNSKFRKAFSKQLALVSSNC